MVKKVVLLVLIICATMPAMAEDYVKDGRPCLNGVCVGDDISALSNVKWEALTDKTKLSATALSTLMKGNFAPGAADAVAEAAVYLRDRRFDNDSIAKLARVKGYCVPWTLRGRFKSDSGHDTWVTLETKVGNDPTDQSLRVERISRMYSLDGYTNSQKDELSRQLNERYQGVKKAPYPVARVAAWNYGYGQLDFYAPERNVLELAEKLKQYPGCGKTLSID